MLLSDCLLKNHFLLGTDCENLGKTRDSYLGGKTLLSYTDKDGWEVRELNVIQLFFRKILGAYKSTHLNHIVKRIYDIQMTDNIKDCHNRIEALWIKKNLVGLGNSDFPEASVICFAEIHGDKCYRSGIAELINDSYREGDIVLVEGIKSDQEIVSEDHQQTEKLKSGCIVRGWEPKNIEEINASVLRKDSVKYEEIRKLRIYFSDNLKMEGELTQEELDVLKVKLDDLIKNIKYLNEYYQSKSEIVLNADILLNKLFEKLKNGTLSSEGKHGAVLNAVILKILTQLEKNEEKAFYKNLTSDDCTEIFANESIRNASLINEINKYRHEGRKVFVIAGAAHLLEFPNPHKSCKDVQNCLQGDRFVVITRKRDFTKTIAELNSGLKSFQF